MSEAYNYNRKQFLIAFVLSQPEHIPESFDNSVDRGIEAWEQIEADCCSHNDVAPSRRSYVKKQPWRPNR